MSSSPAKKRILIMDDEPEIRSLFTDLLQAEDRHFIEAEDGVDGLTKIKEATFDLIISDLNMPKMAGLEFLETIRNQGNLTPVLIVTGFTDVAKIKKAWDLGAFDFVDKPFDVEQMHSLVRNALEFGKQQIESWNQLRQAKRRGAE